MLTSGSFLSILSHFLSPGQMQLVSAPLGKATIETILLIVTDHVYSYPHKNGNPPIKNINFP